MINPTPSVPLSEITASRGGFYGCHIRVDEKGTMHVSGGAFSVSNCHIEMAQHPPLERTILCIHGPDGSCPSDGAEPAAAFAIGPDVPPWNWVTSP